MTTTAALHRSRSKTDVYPADERQPLADYVHAHERGERGAAEDLGVHTTTLRGAIAGSPMQRVTISYLRMKLRELLDSAAA